MTSSAYYFVDVMILAKAAKIFGKQADHEKYNAYFFDEEDQAENFRVVNYLWKS